MWKDIWAKVENKPMFILIGIILLIIIGLEITATVYLPELKKTLFDAIEAKNLQAVINFFIFSTVFLTLFGFVQGIKEYIGHRWAIFIRTALVKILQKKWVRKGAPQIDNPDQRINQDTYMATDMAVSNILEIIISFFITVVLVIQSFNMVGIWAGALVYTAVVSGLMLLFNRPLVKNEIHYQKAEADHRFSLAKIAIGVGDFTSKEKYKLLLDKYIAYIGVVLGFQMFSSVSRQVSDIIPYVILLPLYFAGTITLGSVMQGVSIFVLIVINATIMLQLYPRVTKAQASWHRIKEFYEEVSK
ncbi:MAG: hypothetical protein C0446_08480 [Chitinophaga sp.]|nr:hypothetical protein [Chitinophaga sp.]